MYQFLRFCFVINFSIIFVGCSLINTNQKSIDKKNKDTEKIKACNKYRKNMTYALDYIEKEFEEGYFSKKDIIGAKAQLFLIENNSPSPFAKNINAAKESYIANYDLAKNSNCYLRKYKTTPLINLKESINSLEERLKK